MSNSLAQIFSRIPKSELDMALHCGLLLGSAASIFYLFFGRLLSVPELLSTALKNPTCTPIHTQPPNPVTPSSLSPASSSSQHSCVPSTTNTLALISHLMTKYT